jgi:hypothetical protein
LNICARIAFGFLVPLIGKVSPVCTVPELKNEMRREKALTGTSIMESGSPLSLLPPPLFPTPHPQPPYYPFTHLFSKLFCNFSSGRSSAVSTPACCRYTVHIIDLILHSTKGRDTVFLLCRRLSLLCGGGGS